MKKYLAIGSTLIIAAMLTACGNSDKADEKDAKQDKAKTTTSQSVKEKEKPSKKEAAKTQEKAAQKNADQKATKKDTSSATTDDSNTTNKEESSKQEATGSNTGKSKGKTDSTKSNFSLSTEGFKVSNVEPILGGDVSNVYVNSKASFVKIFRYLTITINQLKVEQVISPTKKVPASDPQSFLNGKNGYVVTVDVSIENRSDKKVTYKANEINLMSGGKTVGGSLDNFVPEKYQLVGSNADPFVFAPHKTARGLVTFTMDEATYDTIKNNTKLAVLSPDNFDAKVKESDKDEDIVTPYSIDK